MTPINAIPTYYDVHRDEPNDVHRNSTHYKFNPTFVRTQSRNAIINQQHV